MHEPQIQMANIGLVDRPNPPVREKFDEVEMERLVASIRENGILVPLMVVARENRFEVVDGDRRLQAAWTAGLREIPVVVHVLDASQVHVQRMLANLDRHDPDPVSEAKYIAKLIYDKTFTFEEISKKLGRSEAWIQGRLTIAEMPAYMQAALSEDKIKLGVALELQEIKDEGTKERYHTEALRNGMSVHSARYNRMVVNEAIEALAESGQTATPENLPTTIEEPMVKCAISDEVVPLNSTRFVRVSVSSLEAARRALVAR